MLPKTHRQFTIENELDLGPDFPFDYANFIGPDSAGNDKPIGEIDPASYGTRIGIVGTGATGLIAGYQLMKIDFLSVYYEAKKNPDGTTRIGGRMKALYGDPSEIAVAGNQPVAVQQPRDQIVAGDADQQSDGIDDVGCGAVALAAAPLRQAPFSMDAARRMNGQHDLAGVLIDIGDHLADHGSNDAFLEP